jgi:hypothetical protein
MTLPADRTLIREIIEEEIQARFWNFANEVESQEWQEVSANLIADCLFHPFTVEPLNGGDQPEQQTADELASALKTLFSSEARELTDEASEQAWIAATGTALMNSVCEIFNFTIRPDWLAKYGNQYDALT